MALKFKCWQRTKSMYVIDSFSPSQNGCNTMSWGVLLYRCYLYRAMLVNMFLYLCFRRYQGCRSSWSSASDSYAHSRRGSSWWASRRSCKPTPTPPGNEDSACFLSNFYKIFDLVNQREGIYRVWLVPRLVGQPVSVSQQYYRYFWYVSIFLSFREHSTCMSAPARRCSWSPSGRSAWHGEGKGVRKSFFDLDQLIGKFA